MNRRRFMAAMMAGGVMTAEGLWVPGQKLISIPSGKVFGDITIAGLPRDFVIGDIIRIDGFAEHKCNGLYVVTSQTTVEPVVKWRS